MNALGRGRDLLGQRWNIQSCDVSESQRRFGCSFVGSLLTQYSVALVSAAYIQQISMKLSYS